MLATIINAICIIAGSLLGLLLKNSIQEKHQDIIYTSMGLVTLVIGIMMATQTKQILILAFAIPLGGIIGTWLDIEGAVLRFGEWLKRRVQPAARLSSTPVDAGSATGPVTDTGFAAGFLQASVLYCVGAMAIIGSFKAGVDGKYEILLTKSVMDGLISVLFAAAMGIGVLFSAFSVLVYQGCLTLLSLWLKPFVSEALLTELTAVGGVLIMMIGLNLLALKKIKTGNFLPALLVAIVFVIGQSFLKL